MSNYNRLCQTLIFCVNLYSVQPNAPRRWRVKLADLLTYEVFAKENVLNGGWADVRRPPGLAAMH